MTSGTLTHYITPVLLSNYSARYYISKEKKFVKCYRYRTHYLSWNRALTSQLSYKDWVMGGSVLTPNINPVFNPWIQGKVLKKVNQIKIKFHHYDILPIGTEQCFQFTQIPSSFTLLLHQHPLSWHHLIRFHQTICKISNDWTWILNEIRRS